MAMSISGCGTFAAVLRKAWSRDGALMRRDHSDEDELIVAQRGRDNVAAAGGSNRVFRALRRGVARPQGPRSAFHPMQRPYGSMCTLRLVASGLDQA
jgi:hypothetical protein